MGKETVNIYVFYYLHQAETHLQKRDMCGNSHQLRIP